MAIQLTVISLDFDSDVAPSTSVYQKTEVAIGRWPSNDLILESAEVSGKHCLIRASETGLLIQDLGSSNGTFVENVPLSADQELSMEESQRVKVGNYLIKAKVIEGTISLNGAASGQLFEIDDESALEGKNGHSSLSAIVEDYNSSSLSVTVELEEEVTEDTSKFFGQQSDSEDLNAADEVVPAADENTSHSAVISGRVGTSHIKNLNFSAIRLFRIRGRVLHHGMGLAGVEIDGGPLGVKKTDNEGCFEFENITEETHYSLCAAKDEFIFELPSAASGMLSAHAEIEFTATQLFTISGTIAHAGEPLAGVVVDGGQLGRTLTDNQGVYTFSDVPEGTEYRLEVSKEGYDLSYPDSGEEQTEDKNQAKADESLEIFSESGK